MGEPIRIIIVSHGGSNLEAAFYALTGVNPMVVGKGKEKGTFKLTEPFRLIMNGPVMSIRFRNRKFSVQRAIKPLLTAQAPGRVQIRESVIQRLTERRKKRMEAARLPTRMVSKQQRGKRRRR